MKTDSDLVLFSVQVGGVRTSVSMDGRMVHYLDKKMGGRDKVSAWVKGTAIRLDEEWREAAQGAAVGVRIRANTGMSRAIQREALDELMRGVDLHPEVSNAK